MICGASWFTAPHMLTSEKINTWSRGLVKTTQALRQRLQSRSTLYKTLAYLPAKPGDSVASQVKYRDGLKGVPVNFEFSGLLEFDCFKKRKKTKRKTGGLREQLIITSCEMRRENKENKNTSLSVKGCLPTITTSHPFGPPSQTRVINHSFSQA